ncbi:MAG: hypothetical protein Q7K57_47185 [Burkholderiaceae bacterium]|nr:hypothetical protein [Burkholderiaceae bacterium]
MIDPIFETEAVKKFVGCDSDEVNAGTPTSPSVWMFGIEHGTYGARSESSVDVPTDQGYSIEEQLRYPYNQKAFKLLAAIEGLNVEEYRRFAEEKQPFVKTIPGYFKGNLYPFACRNLGVWPDDAARETGTTDKREYQRWCRDYRLPAIKRWVEEYQPKLFIGVGVTCRDEFALAVFGEFVSFREDLLSVNGHKKRIFSHVKDMKRLVVVPHFSGANGLNSDESIQGAGEIISGVMGSTP